MHDYLPPPDCPLVSAVIPTRNRPALLACAVRSALRQTWKRIEVIVVVDGPDLGTETLLESLADPRLRVVSLPQSSGGSAARNTGVRAARGEWIALLDDDDEWLPEKIAHQMRAVQQSREWFPVISCRLIAQSPSGSRVLPQRLYHHPQPVADYLFRRTGLLDSGGLMQTSTLLAPRDLLLAIPFREGLPLHQDWDWLINVAAHEGVAVSMVEKPLAIWRVEDTRDTVGRAANWHASFAWIRELRPLVSPRAFSSFIAVQCAWRAKKSCAGWRDRLRLLRSFLFEGRPGLRSLVHFFVFALLPSDLRHSLRRRWQRAFDRHSASAGLSLAAVPGPSTAMLRKSSS